MTGRGVISYFGLSYLIHLEINNLKILIIGFAIKNANTEQTEPLCTSIILIIPCPHPHGQTKTFQLKSQNRNHKTETQ
jgi:hypothetical protein